MVLKKTKLQLCCYDFLKNFQQRQFQIVGRLFSDFLKFVLYFFKTNKYNTSLFTFLTELFKKINKIILSEQNCKKEMA